MFRNWKIISSETVKLVCCFWDLKQITNNELFETLFYFLKIVK